MLLYCLIILICSCIIAVFNALFNSLMTPLYAVVATIFSVICVIIIDALLALIFSKVKDCKVKTEGRLYNISKNRSLFYEKLKIKSWKDKIAELGALNHFRKNKIKEPNNNEYLNKFIIESVKGINVHLSSCLLSFLVIFVLPLKYWCFIGIYVAFVNFALNLLPLMVLQYNIPKIKTLIKYNNRNKNNVNKKD